MTPRTPITGEEVADVLESAADLIEPEGAWTQGDYFKTSDGRSTSVGHAQCFCALGAIRAAGNYDLTGERDWNPSSEFLARWLGSPDICVHVWNDAPERTQAEVVAALRSAATAARQQGEGK